MINPIECQQCAHTVLGAGNAVVNKYDEWWFILVCILINILHNNRN